MEIVLDTHTHTISSAHAYSTLTENARAAADHGLELLCITDHAPGMEDSSPIMHFWNYPVVDRELFGVQMRFGIELDIRDYTGAIAVPDYELRRLDFCIASFHEVLLAPGTCEQNTAAMLGVMANPFVNILGHPDNGLIPVDYEAIVLGAKREQVLLELNNSSLTTSSFRLNAKENSLTMLELCKRHEVMISLGTDAHFHTKVGKFEAALALLEQVDFPEELVVNTSVARFDAAIARKRDKLKG